MNVPFSFTAIDFETTGSVSGYPVEPWQIGIVVMSPDMEPVCWESYLRVGQRPFHPQAPGRHAQLREVLEASPTLESCLTDIRTYCGQRPLVAHNCATEKKCFREALPMERLGPWIDTLKLSRAAWPELPSHKLEDVVTSLGLIGELETRFPKREAHDALYDAYGSALILKHLLAQPGWEGVSLPLLEHPDQYPFWRERGKRK